MSSAFKWATYWIIEIFKWKHPSDHIIQYVILQMKRLRPGKVREFAQGHKTNSCKSWVSPKSSHYLLLLLPLSASMCDRETLVSVVDSGQGWELCSHVHWQFLLCPLGYAFSEDGEYFAYGLSASGSDWVTIKFMKVDGAKELPDVLERVKFSCMAWTHDGKGMFYNAYPQQDGKSDGRLRLQMKHLFHEMKCVATWLKRRS